MFPEIRFIIANITGKLKTNRQKVFQEIFRDILNQAPQV